MSVTAQWPKGALSTLVTGLQAAVELKGYPVLFGRKKMSRSNSAPPRIVVFPTTGVIQNPRNKSTSIRDVNRSVVAHLWGRDSDEVEYLETLLIQALANQGAGGDPVSPAGATAGLYWTATEDVWDQDPDSSTQGEELYMVLTALVGIDKNMARFGAGQVQSIVYQQLTTTLAAPLGTSDSAAIVASTTGWPSSGLFTIDSEQILYTGTTANSLTGLARGMNGTTAATHSNGATVTPSQ